MVLPMKKVSLVVLENERDESLKKLRHLGVAHIERQNVTSLMLINFLERKAKIDRAIGILQSSAAGRKTRKAAHVEKPDPAGLVNQVLDLSNQKKDLLDDLSSLGRERSRMEEWGDFAPRDIRHIAEECGLTFFLYKVYSSAVKSFPEDSRYIIMGGDKNFTRLLVFDRELPGIAPFAPGAYSLGEIDSEITIINAQLSEIDTQLGDLSGSLKLAQKELKELVANIEFESNKAGMGVLSGAPAESAVAWITAYVPCEDLEALKQEAAKNCWALTAYDPGPDDPVPTKLRNNRLVSLINPLTDFLEIVPGYNEPDISLWFLLFFTIFFGMIFGDAGYGAIIVAVAVTGILRNRNRGVPPVFKLMFLLGASNFLWGLLTCTWFGIDVDLLPNFFHIISLPLISNAISARSAAENGIVRQNLMIFCFTFALLQLSIGHIIAITHNRSLKILGELGSIGMLVGMYGIVLILIASNEYRDLSEYIPMLPCAYTLGAGFVLNFVFVNYEGSIGRSVLDSFKNFISMFLGVANVFGDIMSYIRLWAVGLAGGAISSTVNSMAGPMLGHFVFFIFGVILLSFGHTLNIILNMLSVLVHGVRLNTLEFSGHVGLTWAGTPYRPFKEN